ncbi:MAG: 30S ribosomal protein S15 [Candidatus Woesearchaeota archaeon]
MARLYSGKKGKSGSTKPSVLKKPVWLRYNEKEIELLVVKLFKQGNEPPAIGRILRDVYGVPSVKVATGKRITEILEERGIKVDIPYDLKALIKKYVKIDKHMKNNPKDMTAKRGLELTKSKIFRLIKYYKRIGKLSKDWQIDFEKAAFYQ